MAFVNSLHTQKERAERPLNVNQKLPILISSWSVSMPGWNLQTDKKIIKTTEKQEQSFPVLGIFV